MLKLKQLNSIIGPTSRLFIDIKITCHGFITRWNYFANNIGVIFLDVFRPNNNGSFTLISKTKVTAIALGLQRYNLAPEDWTEVEPGFIIGTHYPGVGLTYVIPEENRNFALTTYTIDQLSDVMVTPDLYDDGLIIGSNYIPTKLYSKYSIPAITVDILSK